MNVTKTLTWVSRALFGLGFLLFAALFVYGAQLSRSNVTTLNDGHTHLMILMFCSVAWCWLAGAAARTLATAANWGRAIPEIASIVGFGFFFAIPLVVTSGASAESGPPHKFAAAVCAAVAVLVVVVAKIVAFVAYGAKDAAHAVEQVVDQVQHSIAEARAEEYVGPFVPLPGYEAPTAALPPGEPMEPDRPWPGSQV